MMSGMQLEHWKPLMIKKLEASGLRLSSADQEVRLIRHGCRHNKLKPNYIKVLHCLPGLAIGHPYLALQQVEFWGPHM
jgi:hypothetical protein